MTTNPENDTPPLVQVLQQMHRYFTAVHGKDYVYRAPETFGNVLERWMLAVLAGDMEYADESMDLIEKLVAARASDEDKEKQ